MWFQLNSRFFCGRIVGFIRESESEKCHIQAVIQPKPCPFPHLPKVDVSRLVTCDPQVGAGALPPSQKYSVLVLLCDMGWESGFGAAQASAGAITITPRSLSTLFPPGHAAPHSLQCHICQSKQISSSPLWVFAPVLPASPDATRLPCAVLHTE